MGRTVALLKGGGQVVSETTAQGFGQGAIAAPPAAKDWKAEHTGPSHVVGNVQMRDSLENAIAGAYGVAPAYLNRQATAPALAATKRLAFLDRTLPLAAKIAEELALKLDSPGYRIHWPNLAEAKALTCSSGLRHWYGSPRPLRAQRRRCLSLWACRSRRRPYADA